MKILAAGRLILGLSAVAGIGIGAVLLLVPAALYATIDMVGQRGLLSDLRGTGGSLVALGALIGAGVVWPKYARMGGLVSTVVYLSYAVSRGVAWAIDGKPQGQVLAVMVVEFVLGLLSLVTLLRLPRPAGEDL